MRLGAAGEDVENQLGAIEDLQADRLLEIASLGRGEIVVEDDDVGFGGRGEALQLFDLATAEIGGHVGGFPALGQYTDHMGPGRDGQAFQFVQRVFLG